MNPYFIQSNLQEKNYILCHVRRVHGRKEEEDLDGDDDEQNVNTN